MRGRLHSPSWVLIAFQNAFRHLAIGPPIEDALIETVSEGGDTDTNAAICGRCLALRRGGRLSRCAGAWQSWPVARSLRVRASLGLRYWPERRTLAGRGAAGGGAVKIHAAARGMIWQMVLILTVCRLRSRGRIPSDALPKASPIAPRKAADAVRWPIRSRQLPSTCRTDAVSVRLLGAFEDNLFLWTVAGAVSPPCCKPRPRVSTLAPARADRPLSGVYRELWEIRCARSTEFESRGLFPICSKFELFSPGWLERVRNITERVTRH